MFLKGKRDGSIKGRGVADRRKQQDKIEPKDITSQTVLTEAVMLTEKIDALEGTVVAVVGIFERRYGRQGTRSVQMDLSRYDGGSQYSTIPAICVI